MNELPISSEVLLRTVEDAVRKGQSVIIAGTGDSMRPFIRPETDKLLLAPLPARALLPGDVVLYRRPGGEAVIHRIFRVRGDSYDMLGDNQLLIEQNVPRACVIAYVKEVIRPDGALDCDTDEERRRAVRTMRDRLHPKKDHLLRRCARAAKRRAARLLKQRKTT